MCFFFVCFFSLSQCILKLCSATFELASIIVLHAVWKNLLGCSHSQLAQFCHIISSQDVSFYLCGMCFVCLCLCMFNVIFAREINVVCASNVDVDVASSGSFFLGADGRNREKQVLG